MQFHVTGYGDSFDISIDRARKIWTICLRHMTRMATWNSSCNGGMTCPSDSKMT